MIEDPLYFPKDIPVYMMINMGDHDQMATAIPVLRSWGAHGYTVQKIQNRKSYELDFQLSFTRNALEGPRRVRQQWYNHFRMWKKIRSRNEKSIVIGYRNYLQQDIPRKIYDNLPFFPLQQPYYTKRINHSNVHEQYSGGYFITPEYANILINRFKDMNIPRPIDEIEEIKMPPAPNYPFTVYTFEYL